MKNNVQDFCRMFGFYNGYKGNCLGHNVLIDCGIISSLQRNYILNDDVSDKIHFVISFINKLVTLNYMHI